MTKPVILTGIRANNDLTIGNYFGAMLPIVDMAKSHSNDYQVNMFIPDLHSFTTPIDHSQLHEQILHNALVFAAIGLPLNNNIHLYRQSYISAHSELTWILSCFTGFGQMERMTQFKDKSAGQNEVSVGLYSYPILMAADILLYNATYVPVGDDQTQHLEYTRDIAERMNSRFGQLFTVPEPVAKQHEFFGKDQGLRIMDLQTPTKKMSKSDDSGKGVIFLGENPDISATKVMGAATDSLANIAYDRANQPGITNLIDILALLRGVPVSAIVAEFGGGERYGDFKRVVANELKEFLVDFQTKLAAVDKTAIHAKLESSEAMMREQANATLLRVQQAVGLRLKGE
ncbi:tryptophan--tRNA ligase [Candidatus Saccharibacteria bacterium]|nr:tryptophan--tRNA ligase [Candidatus Saccharibacteria bacterium]